MYGNKDNTLVSIAIIEAYQSVPSTSTITFMCIMWF